MEDTRRHFRVLTGGLSVEKVITKDQGSKYEMKCQSCQNILSSTCDIGTLLGELKKAKIEKLRDLSVLKRRSEHREWSTVVIVIMIFMT